MDMGIIGTPVIIEQGGNMEPKNLLYENAKAEAAELGLPSPGENLYRKRLLKRAFKGDLGAQRALYDTYSLTYIFKDGIGINLCPSS